MVALLWGVACLNYLDRVILITMRSSITGAIPMTDAQFGLLTTVFLVTYGLLSPLGGFIADRANRSRTIVFSLFAWSIATWLTAHATSFGELLCYRSLMGISEACYFPAAGALLMDYHGARTRSLANGLHLSGAMVGSGLGGLGGWIAEKHDWTYVFNFFGIAGIAYAVVLLLLLRDRPVKAGSAGAETAPMTPVRFGAAIISLFSRPAFLLALIFWGLLGFASWAFIGWLPTYLHERLQMSQGQAGLTALGYIYSASLVGMAVSGLWADRWSRRHPSGRVWVGVIGILVAAPAIWVVVNSSSLGVVIAALLVYGFARPFADTNMVPVLCQIIDVRYLATGVGVLNTFATLVGGVSIYLGGALRDAHVDAVAIFNFGAVSMLLCALLLWKIRPVSPPAAPASEIA